MSSGSSSGHQKIIEGTRRRRGPSIPSVIGAEATDMMDAILKETESNIMKTYGIVYKNTGVDIDANVRQICEIMNDENGEEDTQKQTKHKSVVRTSQGELAKAPQVPSKKASQMVVPRTPLSLMTLDELSLQEDSLTNDVAVKTERMRQKDSHLVTESLIDSREKLQKSSASDL